MSQSSLFDSLEWNPRWVAFCAGLCLGPDELDAPQWLRYAEFRGWIDGRKEEFNAGHRIPRHLVETDAFTAHCLAVAATQADERRTHLAKV